MFVFSKSDIKKIEELSAKDGFTYERMMENAAAAAFSVITGNYTVKDKKAVIIVGNGNNGGDGFVLAEKLFSAGADVTVILACGMPNTETAKYAIGKITDLSVAVISITDFESKIAVKSADFIIDAVFGIGFHGELAPEIQSLFKLSNETDATHISLDLPSGACCDDGKISENTFFADLTISFIAVKPCHILYPASDYVGKLVNVGIGIKKSVMDAVSSDIEIITDRRVSALIPKRRKNSHKGIYGTTSLLCGSYGMSGAAILSGKAAMRTGVGLVKLILPESIYPICATALPEAVTVFRDNSITVADTINNSSACLIGPGIGTDTSIEKTVKSVLPQITVPTVLDADGINIISENIDILTKCKTDVILTPHPKEMARLLKSDVRFVMNNRLYCASQFAKKLGVTVVLKGANTLVAAPNGKIFVSMNGNPGMATAGSGDVLAGIITAFCAMGLSPVAAAVCGVHIHGLSGDIGAEKITEQSLIASDIIDNLGEAFRTIK